MRRVPLIVVLAIVSTTVLFAQSNGASSANQAPAVGQESAATVDLLWRISELGSGSPLFNMEYLFPYSAWYLNPSAVNGFSKKTALSYLNYSGSGSSNTSTQNSTTSGGAAGGTQVTKSASYGGTLDLAGFIPFGTNMVAGAEGRFNGLTSPSSTVETNYTANPQNITVDKPSNANGNWQGTGYFGLPLGPLELGASLGYFGSSTPAKDQFTETTNTAVAGGKPYYAAGATSGTHTDTNITDLSGRVGARMPYEQFTFGMTTLFEYRSTNKSNQYIAVDENGDGYAETIVPYSTYATSTAAWGLGLATYSNVNTSAFTTLELYPSARYQLMPKLSLILDGYWTPLSTTSTDVYTHTTTTDKSDATTSLNSGLDNLQAVAGVDYKPAPTLDLRAGAGIGHSKTSFTQTSLNAAGASTFASGNTNNYVQVANFFGATQPNYGNVVTLGGTATTSVSTSYLALVSVSWTPFQRVTFFAGSAFSDTSVTSTYSVYDTTTNTVWTETATNGSGNWALNSLIGVAAQVTKNFSLSLTTNDLAVSGSLGGSSQGLPASGGTQSTNITSPSVNSGKSSFGATLSGVFTF